MINTIESLVNSNIPEYVKEDCLHRINDWLSSEGNKIEDNYVQNIFRYINSFLKGNN